MAIMSWQLSKTLLFLPVVIATQNQSQLGGHEVRVIFTRQVEM